MNGQPQMLVISYQQRSDWLLQAQVCTENTFAAHRILGGRPADFLIDQ